MHLSALALLRDRLTEENHAELLDAVSGTSKREIEALLAARYPAADVPSRIRKLPERPRIEPLSSSRHKVQFTASAELREKLERTRDLLSHANPSGDLANVVERALDLLLADLEKKKLGKVERPRRSQSARPAKRGRVTNAARRVVFARDGLRCTYVGHDGHRCEAQAFLELDHIDPKGLGGKDDADNLRVRCRAHNQLLAEHAYGHDVVDRMRLRRRKRAAYAAPGP